ncbi:alpha-protein kinase 3 [Pelodytes ibericus]
MMGTRRPMTRIPSGNGRYYDSLGSSNGSASESEDSNGSVYNARADSRSYLLNVRPENSSRSTTSRYSHYTSARTTFCSIISQLTEETQPCFETTLKARAVSDGGDAKFICMVTGYPEPEVTWYKDDEEMDRYCGLPKYEIIRNGKRHTLQIYKCSEEDAAIYQASARNNKGIVSCSGVLEVGTMTEYKIHQRWFAKLKRKAEAKMREIEQSRKRVKENLEEGERLRTLSPERIQRKRRFSSENKDASSLSLDKEDLIKVHIPDPNLRLQEDLTNSMEIEQPHNVVNGLSVIETPQREEVTTNGYALPQDIDDQGKDFLAYVYETMEIITKKPTSKESYAKKKKKEDEPPSKSMVDSKKEEPALGSSPKKISISPAPRRSRFSKDTTKAPVVEKMEVQPVPLISNRRFGTSNATNKSAKTIIGKDSKKVKEVVTQSKAEQPFIPKQANIQPKVEVNFSLKDMYFADGDSLPVEEEKVSPAYETDSCTKDDVPGPCGIKQNVRPSTISSPQGQIKEPPKAAPRRSREQRDQTVGSKPSTASSGSMTDVPDAATTLEKQSIHEVKPSFATKQQTTVEKVLEPPEHFVSNPNFNNSEQQLSKSDQQALPPVRSLAPVTPDIALEGKSTIPGKVEKHIDEPAVQSLSTIALGDPPEDEVRTETLQKLKHLEMEYMALQKAYALLQQQLELSQKEEAQQVMYQIIHSFKTTEMQVSETKCMEAQEHLDIMTSPSCDASSPVPVHMETEEAIQLEVLPMEDKQKGVLQTLKSEDPKLRPQLTPVVEFKAEEESNVKDGAEVSHVGFRDKSALQTKSLQTNTMLVVSDDHQPDEETLNHMEISKNITAAEQVPTIATLPTEEMMEDVNEAEQLNEVKEEKSLDSQKYDELTSMDKSVSSSPELQSTLKILESDKPIEMEKLFPQPTEAPHSEEEPSFSENILDSDFPGPILSENLGLVDPNQSVVTLLRDVKKALESGATNNVVSPLDTSPCSECSLVVTPSADVLLEVETVLPLSHGEDKNISDIIPERDLSPDVLDLTSQSATDKSEIVEGGLISKQTSKQDHSLVTSLKNSLLKLLHMKTEEVEPKPDVTNRGKKGDSHSGSPVDMCSPEGSLSPQSSRKIYDSIKDNDSTQSAESMHSSSTSGKLTPTSEEDMIQNADSLQTSPTILRKTTEPFKKHIVTQVESAPLSPVIPKRTSKVIHEETLLSKEDLQFSPSTSRKIAARISSDTEFPSALSVPSIVVGSLPAETLGSFDLHMDNSRKWRSTENISLIPAATPQELALGARRKIYLPKSKQLDDAETGSTGSLTPPSKKESPSMSPGTSKRSNTLLTPQSPPVERRSPGLARRMALLEVPKIYEETAEKEKTSDDSSLQMKESDAIPKEVQPIETKKVNDPYKAPQVIRKIRAEQFSDASGNLKLWCQFFNVLNDSSITWYKDDVQVAKIKRCSGDEGQVALAIVQASAKDCGVYQCTIENDYGTDSTDCLLSAEILSGFILKEEAEVGEEIEMTPMVFAKGLADSGYWGDKFFGRIVMAEAHVGMGFLRKSCRVKVIYGLEPIFESGKTCIIKIRNLITFGTKNESTLVEKNYEITIQDCKIQNTAREYCKIFAAECRSVSNFGQLPEVLPLNLIYRPANNIPYATIEEDLEGRFEKYCIRDITGKLHAKNASEIEQKCCTFQHWVYQWTNGNFLVTNLEGVGWKVTNIGIVTKSKGYQGLKENCCPAVLEEFISFHQCNNYCEMLGLKSLKGNEGLQPPAKPKGSRSPNMGRKTGSAQSSPQIQKKGLSSPQSGRKGGVSPKATRKATETGDTQLASRNMEKKSSDGSPPAKPQ